MESCRFTAELWRWEAQSSWFFVSLPEDASAMIRERPRPPRGFGSVRVRVEVGGSTWTTSVFPDASRGVYVLPVKKSVRSAESLAEGDPADVHLEVLE
ncbi:hypothetical protein N865_05620 [Intrasporangium oryzae NRRL B-24470]|uniref:DUF1905 domain-containing protein n=1 Tax=Intrasporangium oryzae NRRL B-24470 TaxID=1386089 RepID=W9G5E8_9MICO|nr:DUF1905 domain-containing protein [Intrasporangium oryzae]EWT01260.1 hypothetical protein N865_05620 [Intrasporangium oryzae NRRL B-24470]